jgi:hypothetical protein
MRQLDNWYQNNISMRTRARAVEIANNMGHTRLVAHSSSQVDWFLRVILCSRFAEIEVTKCSIHDAPWEKT